MLPAVERFSASAVLGAVAAVVAFAALMCWPLLTVPVFYMDWINHLWFSDYVANNFNLRSGLPVFANTTNFIGNSVFVFYGLGLYSSMIPLVSFLGTDLGIRIAIFLSLTVPGVIALRIFLRHLTPSIAVAATIILLSSIYQLTNLYNRSALTEFFSYQMLLLAWLVIVDIVDSHSSRNIVPRFAFAISTAALAALAHPPTAFLTAIFLGPSVVLAALLWRRRLFLILHQNWRPLSVIFIIALAPLYAWLLLVIRTNDFLAIGFPDLMYFEESIDSFWARLLPWSLDFRVQREGFGNVPTPYLTAPINVCLLILFLGLVCQRLSLLRGFTTGNILLVAFVLTVLAGALIALIVSLPLEATNGSLRAMIFGRVQFAYRLVNLVNAQMIVGCVVLLTIDIGAPTSANLQRGEILWMIIATICVTTIGMKTFEIHSEYEILPKLATGPKSAMTEYTSAAKRKALIAELGDLRTAPSTQYGLQYYSMPKFLPAISEDTPVQEISLVPTGAATASGRATCAKDCSLVTNVSVSPFLKVKVGLSDVPTSQLRSKGGLVVIANQTPGDKEVTIDMGTFATSVYGYATAILALTFWLSAMLSIFAEILARRDSLQKPSLH